MGICVALRDNGIRDTFSKYIPIRKGGRERCVKEGRKMGKGRSERSGKEENEGGEEERRERVGNTGKRKRK